MKDVFRTRIPGVEGVWPAGRRFEALKWKKHFKSKFVQKKVSIKFWDPFRSIPRGNLRLLRAQTFDFSYPYPRAPGDSARGASVRPRARLNADWGQKA